MEFKKLIIILSIAATIIMVCLFGVSYGYYAFSNASTDFSTTVQGESLSVVYAQSEYVNVTAGFPITTEEVPTMAGVGKFSVTADSATFAGYQVAVEVALADIQIDPALKNSDFKIQLLENGTVIKNLTGTNIGNNSVVVLKNLSTITVGTVYNYELRVWIQETGVSQNAMMGKNFKGRIRISNSMKK